MHKNLAQRVLKAFVALLSVAFLGLSFTACTAQSEPEVIVAEITRVVTENVEVTRLVEVPAEVTRIVEIPVEVTRLVEVTVEVTREVAVEATPVAAQGSTSSEVAAIATDDILGVGDEGRDGGLVFTLNEWLETTTIRDRRGREVAVPEGGKFILAKVRILNDGFESDDIYCSWDMGMTLVDDLGREFDHTGFAQIIDLYNIEGNAGCNDQLQPGFVYENETLAFMLPIDAVPAYLKLWDPRDGATRDDRFSGDGSGESAVRYEYAP